MGSPKLKVLVMLVLVAGVMNFGYWYRLDRQAKAIALADAGGRTKEPRTRRREGALPGAAKTGQQLQAARGCDRLAACRPGGPSESAGHAGRDGQRHRSGLAEQDG